MLLKNVKYLSEDYCFHYGDVAMEGGRFAAVTERGGDAPADAPLLLPGLIDLHLHGNSGYDFCEGNYEGLVTMARFLARHGTTGFSPASLTVGEETLHRAYETAVRLRDLQPDGTARILGVTMEGPFFSLEKCGAQNPGFLRAPDPDMFSRLQMAADGMIRIACVAPELPGAAEFAAAVSAQGVVVSAAHTNADYDTACRGFAAGIRHVTHLFNGMPALLHRAPGVIGAAAERPEVTAELIGDGYHVHPSAVRAAFALFGAARICLISDALAPCGMADGRYALGGQEILVDGGHATLVRTGSIAGSTATLLECVRSVVGMGVSIEDAVRCASANPARVLGAADAGVIRAGAYADCILTDAALELRQSFVGGVEVA